LLSVISVTLTTYSLSAVSHVLQAPGGLVLPNEVSIMFLFMYRKLLLYTYFYVCFSRFFLKAVSGLGLLRVQTE
jgi:hypothetical protein